MKSYRNIIIISIILIIITMAIGYSALATEISLNHTAEIVGEWNIKIIDVEVKFVSENCDPGTPEYTNTNVTLASKLTKPGDKIIYEVTIQNAGTIDAILDNLIFKEDENGSPAINYRTTEIKETLNSGEETTFSIIVEYDSNFKEVPEIKTKNLIGIIEYIQK